MATPVLALTPAMTVVEEDFEDDIVDESTYFQFTLDGNGDKIMDGPHPGQPDRPPFFDGTFPERGIGFLQQQLLHINHQTPDVGPSNPVSRPGRWIPNQYPVGSPTEDGMGYQGGQWFDPLDMHPDTDWQTAVVTDFRMMSINSDGPPRQGNEGYIINHHQGDCSAGSPCDNPDRIGFGSHKMAREGFIAFTDGAGNDVVTMAGDVLRGSLLIAPTEGVPVIGLSSDIQALADSTGMVDVDINGDGRVDRDDHRPITKWNVGFGQPFNPIDSGIPGWQSAALMQEVVSQFGYAIGFNETYHMTWLPLSSEDLLDPEGSCQVNNVCNTQVHLDPDTDTCREQFFDLGVCTLAVDDPDTSPFARQNETDPHYRYQFLEFQYTVGETTFDLLQLDGFDVVACDTANAMKDCDDPDTPGAPAPGNVPVSRPGDIIDGFFLGTSAFKNGNSFFFDEICITINKPLDGACEFTQGGGPDPTLLGDANNDNQVTGSDLISVQQNFGKDYTNGACDGLGPGDANDDCLVTGADLISVQQNFGKTLASPVPEPAVLGLLLVGGLSMLRRRK